MHKGQLLVKKKLINVLKLNDASDNRNREYSFQFDVNCQMTIEQLKHKLTSEVKKVPYFARKKFHIKLEKKQNHQQLVYLNKRLKDYLIDEITIKLR